ncbi:MAG: hypothetical protein JW807_05745 [Spirochaetes bacterium]|nr:hypothetical protein [Spirochaetota bacterium]
MAYEQEIADIIEHTRQEILFAIKERMAELTRGTSAPVELRKVTVMDTSGPRRDALRYLELKNVFIDDTNALCGDLVGREDRFNDGVLFGKCIEDLPIDDLKQVLDAVFSNRWRVDLADYEPVVTGRREGLYDFIMSKKAGISRALRRGV